MKNLLLLIVFSLISTNIWSVSARQGIVCNAIDSNSGQEYKLYLNPHQTNTETNPYLDQMFVDGEEVSYSQVRVEALSGYLNEKKTCKESDEWSTFITEYDHDLSVSHGGSDMIATFTCTWASYVPGTGYADCK